MNRENVSKDMGRCPNCGSLMVEYIDGEISDGNYVYTCMCRECASEWNEVHKLAFIGNFVENTQIQPSQQATEEHMTEKEKCKKFLVFNGWSMESASDEYDNYFKNGCIGVDVSDNELVLVGDYGDFLHMPINYYALIGALLEFRQISANYVSVSNNMELV